MIFVIILLVGFVGGYFSQPYVKKFLDRLIEEIRNNQRGDS